MKVYGIFLIAAAMASTVSAGNAEDCAMDPAPAATPAATTVALAVETTAPVVAGTNAPAVTTGAPVTQQSSVAGDANYVSTQQSKSISGAAQSTAGKVSSAYSYTGQNAGGPGSYEQVTNIASCSKTTVTTSSPVSPFDTGVTVAFRGPMTIYNIGVFDGNNGSWSKVSSFAKDGATSNMVFLNNENIDYTGAGSPEGFCKADGTGVSQQPTQFAGTLAAATKPGAVGGLASVCTGAEVHIMTENKCGGDVKCEGAYDNDGTAYQGWTGGKKIFVTKVSMENGGAPNVPAVWMLPDQVTHSGQYGCNCRGMGSAGGCGELDIAEVLLKDPTHVATHYYFYDGTHNPGNDLFAQRPISGPATYVTIIDEDYGVKVLEIGADDFDFGSGSITEDVVKQWEQSA